MNEDKIIWWQLCLVILFLPLVLIVILVNGIWRNVIKDRKQPLFIRRGLIYLKRRMKPNLKIKCKTVDIASTKTRKEFLRAFLATMPPTYFMNGREQCRAKAHRSFSDLLVLTQDRFPKTTEKSVVRIVAQLNIEGLCDIVWCTQVEKFVVRGRRNNPGIPFITNFSVKYFTQSTGVDGISYEHLMKVRDNELID
tara:strand:+ start:15343 stop:15927 length:585 start_codon:yes stop_codon:yes gene_type:complete